MQVLENPSVVRMSSNHSVSSQSRFKVLCIDDDPRIVSGLARNFEARGVEAVCAYDGMQGFWLACSESPDVIITDLTMPKGDGEYVVECLRRNTATRNIPIVVLSGVGVRNLERRIKALHVESAFAKPADFNSLFRTIRMLTNSQAYATP